MIHSAIARLAALVLVVAFSASANGATRLITGTLAPGGPTMPVVIISTPTCLSQGATPVLYRAYSFTVDVGGTYTFTEPSTDSLGLYVHAGVFNPANSFPTCIAASNVNPTNLGVNLTPGTNYTVVVFDDHFAQPGISYSLTISGPGNIIAQCAGFTDLDLGSPFCPNVEWLRNRAITLGCTATTYCPGDAVSRLAMAAFLNRLGNALEPRFAHQSQTAVQAVANGDGVVCQTAAVDTGTYPRVASLSSAMFYHQAPTTVRVATKVVYSINAGVAWLDFSAVQAFAGNVAGSTASQSPAARPRVLPPQQNVLFGIRVDTPSATLSDAGCELAVRLDSHTGASGAFDSPPVSVPPGGANRPSGGP